MPPKPSRLKREVSKRKAHRLSPSAATAFAAAVQHHQVGRLAEADHLYQQVLAINPHHADSLHLLGVLACQLGYPDKGVDLIGAAIEIDADAALYHSNLGNAFRALGQLNEAMASYQRAVALNPDYAEAHSNLGAALQAQNRQDEAVACFRRAVALKPDFLEAHNNLGAALLKQGRADEAADCCRTALALNPNDAEAHNTLGAALRTQGHLDEALVLHQKARDLAPQSPETHNNLGIVLQQLGRLDEALACWDRALAVQPNLYQVHYNRGGALADLDRPTEALVSYDRALALRPDLAEASDNKAKLLTELGRFNEAVETLEKAISLAPRRIRSYYNLTQSRRMAPGDPHLKAMEDLAQDMPALGLDEQIDLYFALGKAFGDIGDNARSFENLRRANALKRQKTVYDEAAALNEFERWRAAFPPRPMDPEEGWADPSAAAVFIVGMPRSGTTLVEQILASHPQVFAAGETDDLARALTALGRPDNPEAIASLSVDQLRQFADDYLRRIGASAPAARRITNKAPDNFRFVGLIRLALPNARIIHLRRDPIDTCLSCFSKQFTGELPYAYDLAELGRYHRGYQTLMAHWRRCAPQNVMLDVDYEAIVADLEGQARRIVAHCGLDWDPRCLDFHLTERPVRTASALQVRQPIYDRSVGRWRDFEPFLKPLIAALQSA